MQALARRVTGGAADRREESENDGQESVRKLHTSRLEEGCQPLEEGVTARRGAAAAARCSLGGPDGWSLGPLYNAEMPLD